MATVFQSLIDDWKRDRNRPRGSSEMSRLLRNKGILAPEFEASHNYRQRQSLFSVSKQEKVHKEENGNLAQTMNGEKIGQMIALTTRSQLSACL
jgi:hypothetical protein